ncbi:MAG: glycosyltransferase [Pirellulales bacterium]|nr:glycosyltransferase [Pirellulales bacterium]
MDQVSTLIQPPGVIDPHGVPMTWLSSSLLLHRPRKSRTLRVRAVGSAQGRLSPGGGEIQLIETVNVLREIGLDARPWREDFDRCRETDVLHIFGSLREHLSLALMARRRGVAVAVSPIAWFDVESRMQESGSLAKRLLRRGKFALAGAVTWTPTWRKRLYETAHVLLPNSDAERRQLMDRFRLPEATIRVVPNGASTRFRNGDPHAFAERVGGAGYVLAPGRIEPRKNQLGLINAMRGQGARLVILGDAVRGHEDYEARCRAAADTNVTFHPRIAHDDPLLASAYASCGCVALMSWFETPGLVALEAGMMGTPLALTDRGCTREYFGKHATYANPADAASIRMAVNTTLAQGRTAELAAHVSSKFTWANVAEATLAGYEQALWSAAARA